MTSDMITVLQAMSKILCVTVMLNSRVTMVSPSLQYHNGPYAARLTTVYKPMQ